MLFGECVRKAIRSGEGVVMCVVGGNIYIQTYEWPVDNNSKIVNRRAGRPCLKSVCDSRV